MGFGAVKHEARWRQPASRFRESDIGVSRSLDPRTAERSVVAVTPAACYVVSICLTAVRLSLTSGSELLFEGLMAPGTLHISIPSEQLVAKIRTPCDFLHVYAGNAVIREGGQNPDAFCIQRYPFRDRLVEMLGRSLVESSGSFRRAYVESVCRTIAMRALGRRPPERWVSGLPKWRFRKLQKYVDANISETIGLCEMAAAAGLSRMHFAAQFRAATGLRPHEYLMLQRVEKAKHAMAESDLRLIEIALSAGFQTQAHFSTVFKRFTGMSPARWKREARTGDLRIRSVPPSLIARDAVT